MRKKCAVVMSLIVSMTANAVAGTLPVKAATMPSQVQTKAAPAIAAHVEARYSSNRIYWNAAAGVSSYDIYTAGDDDDSSKWEELVKNVSGTEYIDNTAGTGTHKGYIVAPAGTDVQSAAADTSGVVRDMYSTGIEAVQEHAKAEMQANGEGFQVNLLGFNNGNDFDGNSVAPYTANSNLRLGNLTNLTKGTILITFKPDNSRELSYFSNHVEFLLNIKQKDVETGKKTNLLNGNELDNTLAIMRGWHSGKADANNLRYEFTAVSNGSKTFKAPYDNCLLADGWTTSGFSVNPTTATSTTVDMVSSTGYEYTYTGDYLNKFLNGYSGIDYITIGGVQNGTVKNSMFKGKIAEVTITDEVMEKAELIAYTKAVTDRHERTDNGAGSKIREMYDNSASNTWLFTGGEEAQGGFSQTQGMRNYVGHFEEYIRWKLAAASIQARQRYTINVGKAGKTLSDIITEISTYETKYDPRAVVYMAGHEDYDAGADVNTFKANLKLFIDAATAMRSDNGFAVIQKPHAVKDSAKNALVQQYSEAIDAVVETYKDTGDVYKRIVVVESNLDTTSGLTNDLLNKKGHYETARALALATNWTDSNFPGVNYNLQPVSTVETYLKAVKPSVSSTDDTLTVTIPEQQDISRWKYTLTLADKTVSGKGGNTFAISNLEQGVKYKLTIQSEDGRIQLKTVRGVVEAGNTGSGNEPALTALQTEIKNKMNGNKPLTWLFMGDSITHGAAWTAGQDSIAQSFEKYLRDDLGRGDDVVINTAVSGATVNNSDGSSTITALNERLSKYKPDIVSIMLGTNDATNADATGTYETNLTQIINEAKKWNATVILRTPLPCDNSAPRPENCKVIAQQLKSIAEKNGCIYVDQYTPFETMLTNYSYLWNSSYTIFGDGNTKIHPGANGHLLMTRMFIEACGLWDDDTFMVNHFYNMGYAAENSSATYNVTNTDTSISLALNQLSNVKDVTLKAVSGGVAYETNVGKQELTLANLPAGTYTVSAYGYSTETAKKVTYSEKEITLDGPSAPVDKAALKTAIDLAKTKVEASYTTDSYQSLKTLLEAAEDVYKDTTATQIAVTEATDDLNAAIDALVERGDKTALEKLIQDNDGKDLTLYTDTTAAAFTAALKAAKEVKNNIDATVKDVADAQKALQDAITALELKPVDKQALKALLDLQFEENKYTADSYAVYKEARDAAQDVYDKASATADEVTEAAATLKAAQDALEEKSSVTEIVVEGEDFTFNEESLLERFNDVLKEAVAQNQELKDCVDEAIAQNKKLTVQIFMTENGSRRDAAEAGEQQTLGNYEVCAALLIDDDEVYRFEEKIDGVTAQLDIPARLLEDDIASYELMQMKGDGSFEKVNVAEADGKLKFATEVGARYTFAYTVKAQKPEDSDDNKPGDNKPNDDKKEDSKPGDKKDDGENGKDDIQNPAVDADKTDNPDPEVSKEDPDFKDVQAATPTDAYSEGAEGSETGDASQPFLWGSLLVIALQLIWFMRRDRMKGGLK